MSRLAVYFGRLVVILAGFLAASLCASAFLHLLILGGLSWTPGELGFVSRSFLFSVPFVALFVGNFALIPFGAVILVAEIWVRRDWLYFALAGAITGLMVVYLYRVDAADEGSLDRVTMSFALAASGAVGGICYWLVAGRSSGRWARKISDTAGSGRPGF